MSSRLSESPSALPATKTDVMTRSDRTRAIEAMKSMYKAAQQAEYLHLQAEAEMLLQQLQTAKQRRQTSDSLAS